jgi:hypothetical protein
VCLACIALIEEINWQTGITDPKKKIQIGNFQLDAKGNMKAREVKCNPFIEPSSFEVFVEQ